MSPNRAAQDTIKNAATKGQKTQGMKKKTPTRAREFSPRSAVIK